MTPSAYRLSPPLLRAWMEATGLAGPDGTVEIPSGLSRAVKELSELFTRGRKDLPQAYLDEAAHRQAYLTYYFPVNLAKVQMLLAEMPEPDNAEVGGPFTVLDVGCGTGSGALGVLDWVRSRASLKARPLHLVAVERSSFALETCSALWASYLHIAQVRDATVVPAKVDLERFHPAQDGKVGGRTYDLIIVANTLNELFAKSRDPLGRRVDLVRALLGLLDRHGTLMIVEPALRETSRELHRLRNVLAEGGDCGVYSPCLHEQPCPALLKETDWCHEERIWEAPPLVEAIDREVDFIKDAVKFSYLLLRKDGKTVAPRQPDIYRVVSELRVMKGEKRAWLCSEAGRHEVGRQDRLRSESNAPVDDWHRGAIVRIDQIVRKHKDGGLGRIPADAKVEIVRPV